MRKWLLILSVSVALAAMTTGCTGNAGTATTPATSDGQNSVATMVRNSAPLDNCPNGGISVDAGIDKNGNGTLDASEVTSTQYVCNGVNGADGTNGANGTNGTNGSDGLSALVSVVSESSGTWCPNGGRKVSVGQDADKNGILSSGEVSSSDYICNGLAGTDGSNGANGTNGTSGTNGTNGLNTLVSIVSEPAGTNCIVGGIKVKTGLDSDKNGTLDSGEVASVSYVCNGTGGASGQPDTQAPSVPTGLMIVQVYQNALALSWNTSTDNVAVAGYKVYRNGSQIGTTSSNVYNDTGLVTNASYTYTVSAYDAVGNVSSPSAPLVAYTDIHAPSVPAFLTMSTFTAKATDLAWQSSTDNLAVVGYNIYRNGAYLTSTAQTFYTDQNLAPDFYCYYIAAYDNAGNESTQSDQQCATSWAWTFINLPDTGQTTTYTATFGQDADYSNHPPAYIDNGNGTVTDNVTDLMWQKQDDGLTRNWNDAGRYCGGLSLGGQTDWRLPSDIELMSIVDYGAYSPSINTTFFPNTQSSDYWSSSTAAPNIASAWIESFINGYVGYHGKTSSTAYVRCVRGGQ